MEEEEEEFIKDLKKYARFAARVAPPQVSSRAEAESARNRSVTPRLPGYDWIIRLCREISGIGRDVSFSSLEGASGQGDVSWVAKQNGRSIDGVCRRKIWVLPGMARYGFCQEWPLMCHQFP